MTRTSKSVGSGLFLAFLVACQAAPPRGAPAPETLEQYDVLWRTPSRDASGSMPLGNGEVGVNLWVEESGDLCLLLARTDAFSEASRVLKLGRVRLHLEPSPLAAGAAFRQHLKLRDGRAEIECGDLSLTVFVDSERPIVRVVGSSPTPRDVSAMLEVWRDERRELTGSGPYAERTSSWTMHQGGGGGDTDVRVFESADVVSSEPEAVVWYHRNESSVVPFTLAHQGLAEEARLVSDPLLHRTFGGRIEAAGGFVARERALESIAPTSAFELSITTHSGVTESVEAWLGELRAIAEEAPDAARALGETERWWQDFWSRSWIFVDGDGGLDVPASSHPLRVGFDSTGASRFEGGIARASVWGRALADEEIETLAGTARGARVPIDTGLLFSWSEEQLRDGNVSSAAPVPTGAGLTLEAWIRPGSSSGRIFDALTAGQADGFLFDTHPGRSLRLIYGDLTCSAMGVLTPEHWLHVAATVEPHSGRIAIYLGGTRIYERPSSKSSAITRAWVLQRWTQACGGRGRFPIKFNGSIFTVEPRYAGAPDLNPDWRRWGDCHWWQNLRLAYHPMLACGDFELMEPLWRLYEDARPLAEARTRRMHAAEGAYFPETMTIFGTYSNGDYGWNREGHEPGEVLCPWWKDTWNQGLELVALMLDRYDYTGDEAFLRERTLPMAESVLRWFDTRFERDAQGALLITPTQSLETYWTDVVNDMPCVAGLASVTRRLVALPEGLTSLRQRELFERLRAATPALPAQLLEGGGDSALVLAPAQKFAPERSNCESPELYALFPFRLFGLGRPDLDVARRAWELRHDRFTNGWPQDGQDAALLGLVDEARANLRAKSRNSHTAYRWPATWGPNFDWLPDQTHGGNLMTTLQLMLLQCDGDEIRLLPAWPMEWDVHFKLAAPQRTTVECELRGGRVERLVVDPPERAGDVLLPVR